MSGTVITEKTPFDQPIAEELDDAQLNILSTTEITASIIGVATINCNRTCFSCNKAVVEQGISLAKCVSCCLTQKMSRTNKRWHVKLFIEDSTNRANKFHVTFIIPWSHD